MQYILFSQDLHPVQEFPHGLVDPDRELVHYIVIGSAILPALVLTLYPFGSGLESVEVLSAISVTERAVI